MQDESQASICQWAKEAFGAPNPIKASAIKLNEEVGECIHAVNASLSAKEIGEECADVFIVLAQIADAAGIDLQHYVNLKMAKNRARKWQKTPEGVFRHI